MWKGWSAGQLFSLLSAGRCVQAEFDGLHGANWNEKSLRRGQLLSQRQ